MTFNDYQAKFPAISDEQRAFGMRPILPRITCADGVSLSVQVGAHAYCSPRSNDAHYYHEVEVGFPSEKIEEIMQWAEDADNPTETVYGYIPVEIVDAVIAKHGGIKE